MVLDLPKEMEAALEQKAVLRGVTTAAYVREVLDRELAPEPEQPGAARPFKKSYGLLARFGPAPTDQEMEENRRDMFANFGEEL